MFPPFLAPLTQRSAGQLPGPPLKPCDMHLGEFPKRTFGRTIARPSIEATAQNLPNATAAEFGRTIARPSIEAISTRLARRSDFASSAGQLPGPPLKPPVLRAFGEKVERSAGQLPGPPLKPVRVILMRIASVEFGRTIARPSIEAWFPPVQRRWPCSSSAGQLPGPPLKRLVYGRIHTSHSWFGRTIARPSIEARRTPLRSTTAAEVRPDNCPALH